ncbi:hypothetical protein BGZ65_001387 [Modicella reniformis]|uniref:PX domain-containing protein n=1 Tax=Modicella reniformis TaxID=1440133 RepID=A0A9P6MA36_9FUNG|nr:hypothetical protein BGZ65_001387 [Modicella reniformis]
MTERLSNTANQYIGSVKQTVGETFGYSDLAARGVAQKSQAESQEQTRGMTNDTATKSQQHYLKQYLLGIQIKEEFELLQRDPYQTLPHLGGPFDPKDEHAESTTPFLRYLFESIVMPFPFLTNTKHEPWPKLQQFLEEWAKVETGNGVEHEEMVRRKHIRKKCERAMVMMYSMAIKTPEQRAQEAKEEELRKQQGLEDNFRDLKLDSTVPTKNPTPTTGPAVIHGVRINLAGIRVVREKRHVREHDHAEFLISSTLPDGKEYIVARRHARFRRLYVSLREHFPQFEFPLPPAKLSAKSRFNGTKVAWEKDRISLRGYLRNLARVSPKVVTSSVFTDFLTKDTVTLTEDEMKDVQTRAALDKHRMEQQSKFDQEVANKVKEIDSHLNQVKVDLLQPGGISRLFSALRQYDKVEDLPSLYRIVFEWGCMNFASTLYHMFTASDDAIINFAQLKRTQMLMPYRTMWGILKISNPMAMMKGIVDLFLAQPFGKRSLMQRIISVNIQEEIAEYKKDVTHLEGAIGDPALCEKIKNYVQAPKTVVDNVFSNGVPNDITSLGFIMDILKSDQILPSLQPAQIKRVLDSQQQLDGQRGASVEGDRFSDQSDEDDHNDGSDDYSSSDASVSDASVSDSPSGYLYRSSSKRSLIQMTSQQTNLMRCLQQLLVTQLRIQDKERLIGLVFQGVTAEILKELMAIFYEPLLEVYKSANVADSLMDVKDFADELLKIVEQADINDNDCSGKPTIATLYLNLAKKHLPNFYKFVHSVHKLNNGLFQDLLEWVESTITFMRTGYARTGIDYKTQEEIRVTVDLIDFVRVNVERPQWEELQREAQSLQEYFILMKERKREEVVRRMAGFDHTMEGCQSSEGSLVRDAQDRERERMTMGLRGIGMQQEDVDELEMMSYHNQGSEDVDDDEHGDHQRNALKAPKVPVIDTLKGPFIKLMDRALFQSARE